MRFEGRILESLVGRRIDTTSGDASMEEHSEHTQAEVALAQSQALLSTLVESTDDMIWTVNPRNFGLLMFNHALKDYFSQENNIDISAGMTPEEMLPPAFASKWHALYQRALREGSFVEEYRVSSGRHTFLLTLSLLKRNGEAFAISVFGKDITGRKQAEEILAERLAFERLLADLSAHFINLSPEMVDREIEDAQRRVCEFLGLDLSALWQWSDDNSNYINMTHLYRPLGGPPTPEPMDADEYFPWNLQQLRAGKTVVISSTEDLPAEAARDREVYRYYGIKASLAFPLSVAGRPILGVLSFNDMQKARAWPEEVVNRLGLVAQIFANALARKHSDKILLESEERLSLATEGSGVGLWIMDLETHRIWVTPRTRELFHFDPDEEVNYDSFLRMIHVEDRERVQQDVRETQQSGAPLLSEFRVVLPEGNACWVLAHGGLSLKNSGKPDRLVGVTSDVTERKQLEEQLKSSLQETLELRKQLERENAYLKEEYGILQGHSEIVGQSLAIQNVFKQIEQVAPTDSHVLITGETGTGKELVARAIHGLSQRKGRMMVTVNCATLSPTLIESELFGREKGAYTGALIRQIGRFELADGGTIFLDEIGELPFDLQSKLLRVLQEGEFERLGGPAKTIRVNVRVIAAANKDLAEAVRRGEYRKDLYYRLSVFPIEVPPLRERADDIPLLTWAFIDEFGKRMGKKIESVSQKTMDLLKGYAWPGNVRELRNIIERAMILSSGDRLEVHLPKNPEADSSNMLTLDEAERRHILDALQKTGWRVKGPQGAAALLDINPSTLYSRMEKLGIPRRPPKNDISH